MIRPKLYLWNREAAIRYLEAERLTCRACGEKVPYHPLEGVLSHILTHAKGKERARIKELLDWLHQIERLPEEKRIRIVTELLQPLAEEVESAVEQGIFVRIAGFG